MYSYDASGAVLSDRHRDPSWSMGSGGRSSPTGSKQSASMPGVGAYNPTNNLPEGLTPTFVTCSLPIITCCKTGAQMGD